jgi:signal transduction histidine kinase/FixJ family two-component response regulator
MPEKILLVDDESGIRTVLGITIADAGYEVVTAETAEDALELFDETQPGIVVTDIKMPGMDGIGLLKEIKKRSPETEVIMITGHGDLNLAIESLQLDAADFVTKPINNDILEASLKRVEEKLRMKRELDRYTHDLERMVEEKSARYRELFEQVPCYITVQDESLRIMDMNERFREDFGGEPGNFCYKVYKGRDEPCENCPVKRTFRDGQNHECEEVVASLDGEQRYMLINTSPIRNDKGEIVQVMEMSTDITQIRKLQDRLTNLGLLLSSVSHGVKGQLTALDGGVYRLESGVKRNDPERILRAMETIKDVTDNIKHVVLDILYYAKSRNLNWDEVDVAELAEKTAKTVQPKAAKQNVEFISSFEDGLGSIEADYSLLSSAMVNLLENAVDACSSDRSKKEHRIVYEVRPDGDDHVMLSVVDDGTGMDAETRNKIFSLFFSSKGRSGTGLGLFIANQVIEQHGGKIDVNSTKGQGSCFDVRLPRVLPESAKKPDQDELSQERAHCA